MSIKASTGLRNAVLDSDPLGIALELGFIKIYSGAIPATADAALGSATLLVTISVGSSGTGLLFEDSAVDGAIAKLSGQVWSGVNVAGGTASFYRHVLATDDGTLSTTQLRIQGAIANVGSDMNLTNIVLATGATQTVDYYQLSLPTL